MLANFNSANSQVWASNQNGISSGEKWDHMKYHLTFKWEINKTESWQTYFHTISNLLSFIQWKVLSSPNEHSQTTL